MVGRGIQPKRDIYMNRYRNPQPRRPILTDPESSVIGIRLLQRKWTVRIPGLSAANVTGDVWIRTLTPNMFECSECSKVKSRKQMKTIIKSQTCCVCYQRKLGIDRSNRNTTYECEICGEMKSTKNKTVHQISCRKRHQKQSERSDKKQIQCLS